MKQSFLKFTAAAVLGIGLYAAVTGTAVAAVCSDSIEFKVHDGFGNNDGCEIGTENNDNPLPGQVNDDGMFDFSDWKVAGKYNFDTNAFSEEEVDIDFDADIAPFGGDWSVVDTLFSMYSDLMIVLKGGNGQGITPGNYVGYLFTASGTGATSGEFLSPFSKNGNVTGISHITAYVRGTGGGDEQDPPPVPLPAAGWMLLAGLGGLAAMRRRKKA